MGLLGGKKGLILHVANDRSIAWHIGHNAIHHGANCGFGYLVMGDAEKSLRRAKKSLDELGAPGGADGVFLHECDVSSDASIEKFFGAAKDRFGTIDLGAKNIRVNCISAGPIRTLAAMGVGGIDEMLEYTPKKAPLKRNIDADEVGKTAVYLLSDLSSGVTGETLYVDAGFNNVGL